MGILGAILGGLKFKLDEHTQQRWEAAEARKAQRLEELAMAREGRDNTEWERRQGIQQRMTLEGKAVDQGYSIDRMEVGHVLGQDDIKLREEYNIGDREDRQVHDSTQQVRSQNFTAEQNTVNHERQLERDRIEREARAESERIQAQAKIAGVRVFGSDSKLYDPGAVPPGVHAVGIVSGQGSYQNLPSASKSGPAGGSRLEQLRARAGNPVPAQAPKKPWEGWSGQQEN